MIFTETTPDIDEYTTTYITPENWQESCVLAAALCRTKYNECTHMRIELQVSPYENELGVWGHLLIFDLSTPTFSSSLFPAIDSATSAREHRQVEVRGVIDSAGRVDVEWRMAPDAPDFEGYELPPTNPGSWRPAYDLSSIKKRI